MLTIKTHQELWGQPFPRGGEWDAGYTAPYLPFEKRGRWTVRHTTTGFAVLFYYFHSRQENLLAEFPASAAGEIAAKTCALQARELCQTHLNS